MRGSSALRALHGIHYIHCYGHHLGHRSKQLWRLGQARRHSHDLVIWSSRGTDLTAGGQRWTCPVYTSALTSQGDEALAAPHSGLLARQSGLDKGHETPELSRSGRSHLPGKRRGRIKVDQHLITDHGQSLCSIHIIIISSASLAHKQHWYPLESRCTESSVSAYAELENSHAALGTFKEFRLGCDLTGPQFHGLHTTVSSRRCYMKDHCMQSMVSAGMEE
ncbi:hypothetical protein RRG08_044856 [Elysia crispata]|uniref:Uncharacterized protein n=1 Tax=Elysia crispata TaxID=231223 RepID=A0AAE1DRR0_9GAST|nr:hypothetical protein RRG08_044856 [Elysia crispata]